MMLSSDTQMSFGRYLQWCRKTKNLSLDVIANDLKVGIGVLTAIENEDFSIMPEKVFTKGFLRGFARLVDADEARVIQDYYQRLQQFKMTVQSNRNMIRENNLFWQKLMMSAAVIFSVIFLTIFFSTRSEGPKPVAPKKNVLAAPDPLLSGLDNCESTIHNNTGSAASTEAPPTSGMIRLSIITIEETWMKINIDNEKIRKYTLRPGDRLEFEAARGYNLLIGNAAGVKLFANKVPVDIPEEKGKVINIDIPGS